MLLPNRVKHRKQHRGRMKGRAMRGNSIVHGDFGWSLPGSPIVRSKQPVSP